MPKKIHKIIYALKNNEIVSINDVDKGLKCGCICQACGEKLVARKGKIKTPHFAHYSGSECEYAYESILHLMSKEILASTKEFVIPAVYIEFPGSYKQKELISEATKITIDKVELEKRFDNVVPDIVVYSHGKSLFIEIFVTHKIDDNKHSKLREKNISTIEIDLSKIDRQITYEELKRILISDCSEKRWVFNAFANNKLKKYLSVSEKYMIIRRGFASHIDNCPINRRIWKGRSYANMIDDCLSCSYCISIEGSYVYCSGAKRISSLTDFGIPFQKRLEQSNNALNKEREIAVGEGRCPYCGSALVMRNGKNGRFFGCSSYPHCMFTAQIDKETGEVCFK